jgi:hypothetical protein
MTLGIATMANIAILMDHLPIPMCIQKNPKSGWLIAFLALRAIFGGLKPWCKKTEPVPMC